MRLPLRFLQAVLSLQLRPPSVADQTSPVCMLPGVTRDSHFGDALFLTYQQSSSG